MNNICKRYSQDVRIRMMILVILHEIISSSFLYDRNSFEDNMANMVALGTPVSKMKAVHNCAKVANQESNDAMGLRSLLYLA